MVSSILSGIVTFLPKFLVWSGYCLFLDKPTILGQEGNSEKNLNHNTSTVHAVTKTQKPMNECTVLVREKSQI